MYNKMTLLGRLGQDAEIKVTGSGKTYIPFSVATDSFNKKENKKDTYWFNCVYWPRENSKLIDYLKKGQVVYVEGEMRYNEKDGKRYYSVNTNVIKLVGGKQDNAKKEPSYTTTDVPF